MRITCRPLVHIHRKSYKKRYNPTRPIAIHDRTSCRPEKMPIALISPKTHGQRKPYVIAELFSESNAAIALRCHALHQCLFSGIDHCKARSLYAQIQVLASSPRETLHKITYHTSSYGCMMRVLVLALALAGRLVVTWKSNNHNSLHGGIHSKPTALV